MICKTGQVKILDFGLAKRKGMSKITQDGSTLGTQGYMSPEQVEGLETDARSDIFSFGVVLYEMATGKLPFEGDHEAAVLYSIVNEEPIPVTTRNPNMPQELERIIHKALEKDVKNRYQHADDIVTDLRRLKRKTETGREAVTTTHISIQKRSEKQSKWRIPIYVAAVLIVLIIGVMIYSLLSTKPPEIDPKSIAVLPFTSIGDSKEGEYFCDGIHDDILAQLAKIKDLKVIARTSVIKYKDTDKGIKEIGNELNVASVLEGSIRRADNQIRIVTQLIDTDTEQHIWAETYNREYADIFAIQSDIAQNIAEALEATLTSEEKSSIERKPTENMEAYDCYLKGNHYWYNYYTKEGNFKATEMYEKAIDLDPGFSQAYAMLSMADFVLYNRWPEEFEEYLEKGLTALNMATTLGPDLMEVHLAQGRYFQTIMKDIDKALSEYSIALKKQPNSSVHNLNVGDMYIAQGKIDLGEKYFKRAEELDPSWFMVKQTLSNLYAHTRDYEKALGYANECITLRPESVAGHLAKLDALLQGYGNLKECRIVINEAEIFLASEDFEWWFGLWKYIIELYSRNYLKILSSSDVLNYLGTEKIRLADIYYLLSKPDKYIPLCDSLKIVYELQIKENPDDIHSHWVLGRVYALLGQKKEALMESQKAADLFEIPKNWNIRTTRTNFLNPHVNLVHVLILIDKPNTAMDHLEYLLSIPCMYSTWDMKLDPFLDTLRGHPRFQELIVKYEGDEG
jgi:TolB-like protein